MNSELTQTILAILTGSIGGTIVIMLIILGVLMPFYIYLIYRWSKRTAIASEKTLQHLELIASTLDDQLGPKFRSIFNDPEEDEDAELGMRKN